MHEVSDLLCKNSNDCWNWEKWSNFKAHELPVRNIKLLYPIIILNSYPIISKFTAFYDVIITDNL